MIGPRQIPLIFYKKQNFCILTQFFCHYQPFLKALDDPFDFQFADQL